MAEQIPGITVRHVRGCTLPADHRPNAKCMPTYQAHVWDRRARKRIRKTFPTLSAARAWRQEAVPAIRRGTLRAPSQTTLRQAWETWLAGAKEGTIRTRSGDVYKPSALRGYEQAMRDRFLADYGAVKLSEISRLGLQDLADRWLADGLDPSTIRNAFMPLRVLYRRALSRGDVAVNPTTGLELPAVRGRRDRIASPVEAATLIAALPEGDRAVWATAAYAGLRLGELQALRDRDVDLAAGVIRIERAWDKKAGVVAPKSRAGTRKVPIVAALRTHLAAHRLRRAANSGELFFGSGGRPFDRGALIDRAHGAWAAAAVGAFLTGQPLPVEVEQLGLHEARHTCASIFIAAGVNAKALSTYLGHSSITITIDRYGHLMPGNEDEAVQLVDTYLERVAPAASCATVARQS
ncbi:MAG: tyrosine-type recombinase/integrase [Gaiellaceae bacterium]